MKIKFLILLTCFFLNTVLFSQSQPKAFEDWKTTTGSQNFFYKNITKTDGLGNVYVAGATVNGAGNTDILLAKYNSVGVQLWIRQYAGSANGTDFAADLTVTNANAFLTGAVTNNTTTMLPDIITISYKHDGTFQWATTYNGVANSLDVGKSIIRDAANGNIYVTGTSYNTSSNADIITLKYNSSGVQQWANTYNHSSNLDDAGFKVVLKGTTAITVSGAVTIGTNQYKYGTFVCSQTNGSITASTIGTFVTTSSITAVSDFITEASGNSIIVGSMYVAGQGDNMYVQKLGTTLVPAWTYTYNNPSNLDDVAKAVQIDASGNVYITGYSAHATEGRNITTIKLNSSGVQQWLQTTNSSSNGNDEAADMAIDASSNIYIAGYIQSDINQADYYTAKYNSAGTKLWEVQTDGLHLNDQITNIALDSLNNVIVTGQSEVTTGNFEFLTTKYVQTDVITPTDFNGENPSEAYWYYSNKGQLRDVADSLIPSVLYHTDKTTPNMYIKNNSMSFVFAHADTLIATNDTLQKVDLTFDFSNVNAKTYPLETQRFGISFFNGVGRDFSNVNANRKLITPNIFPNIDLMYSSNENGIKYYYIVKPGGDPRNILLTFTGATSYSLDATTNELSVNTLVGDLKFDRPTAYQLSTTNTIVAITTWTPSWQTNGASNKYKFSTGAYTTSLTLVIEVDKGNSLYSPIVNGNLVWNTFHGGNSDDYGTDMKLDRYGNIYTLSGTFSTNFYMNNTNTYNNPILLYQASWIVKYNKFGKRQNQVYVGSSFNTAGTGITIVNDSSLVLVGSSAGSNLSGPFGGTNPIGAYTSTFNLGFILKFENDFNKVLWSTRFPGIISDCDSKTNGDIYIVSNAYKPSAYLLNQTGATNIDGSSITNNYSSMVTKFTKNGAPLWSSFTRIGILTSYGSHIKIDTASNSFYVFGIANGTQDWTGYNNYGTFFRNTNVNASRDCYIKKFNSADSMVVSTFVGGNKNEDIADAAISSGSGDICFVGHTYSTDTTNIVFTPNNSSYMSRKWDNVSPKGWIMKFSPTFQRTWSTLYGDSLKSTLLYAVTADNIYGSVLMGGKTEGMPNVYYPGCYYKNSDPQGDAAFLSFNPTNNITWATSMGANGINEDGVFAMQFNPKNNNLDFIGASGTNAGYPWENYAGSYWQPLNAGPGRSESTVGRFDAVLIIGVDEQQQKTSVENNLYMLYPNPANTIVNVKLKQGHNEDVTMALYNALGQIVDSKEYKQLDNNTVVSFNTQNLIEGVYFMRITTKKSTESMKFIINK